MKRIVSSIGVMALALTLTPLASGAAHASTGTVAAAKGVNVGSYFALPLPQKGYRVSSFFGPRCPIDPGSGTFHGAMDLALPDGEPIFSVMAGTVTQIDTETGPDIHVDHGMFQGKKLETVYTHMWDPHAMVKVGQKVARGERIAQVGADGIANGPHLHFNVYWGGESAKRGFRY